MIPYQIIYRTVGLFLLLSVPPTESQEEFVKITLAAPHELMTDEEFFEAFHTTRDKMPEYEIVEMEHSLHKRKAPQDFRLKFKAFGRDVDVYLNPTEGILVGEDTPVWIAEYFEGSVHYRRLKQGIMNEVLGVYQSVPGRAALVVRPRSDRDLQFDGTIEDLSVIPLSPRIQEEMKKIDKKKRDLPRTSGSMMVTDYHIVFKTNKGVNQNNTAEQNNEGSSNQSEIIRSKRGWDVVFPTILVTTDFNIAVNSKEDSAYYDQLIYQLAFWNGVDLKFRTLTNPKVRLRIAGFIIGSGRAATPYVNQHVVDGKVEISPAFLDMRSYWNKMRAYDQFSSEAFHIRSLDLFDTDPETGKKEQLAGRGGLASICRIGEYTFYSSILFQDDLSFADVNSAVHELGHVLGANHDEPEKNSCPSADGYLMAPVVSTTQNNPKWSKCSLETMSRTLGTDNCTDKPRNKYPPGEPLGKFLPGTLKTDHEQCQARGYDWACAPTENICRVLQCYYTGWYGFFATLFQCQYSRSAAEGTECAPGKVCLDGECKSLY